VESALLLDVVVAQGAAILQLLTSEDQALLVRWDTLLILDLRLNVVDGVRGLNFQRNSLSSQGLHENLHTTTETEHQVQGALLLNVVIRQGSSILKLLSSENETLLVGWDTLLILNFGLHVVDGVRRFYFQSNGLPRKSLNKDLHTTTQTKDQVKSGFLLDVVVRQSSTILKLLAREDQTLLVRRNTLLVLNLALYIIDGVGRLHLKGDGLSGEGLNEDLHTTTETEHEMEGRLFLNIVVGKGAAVLELLASEDKTLLIRGNSFLVLDLALNVVDGIRGFDLKSDGLASESLDEDLHFDYR